jgi:hypothetical protein
MDNRCRVTQIEEHLQDHDIHKYHSKKLQKD